MSHSFGIPSPGVFHRDVALPHFVYIAFLLWKGNSSYENDTRPTDSNEKIDHVCMQQRYTCNWEGTHVILFIFPGFAVKDQSYIDMAKQIPI